MKKLSIMFIILLWCIPAYSVVLVYELTASFKPVGRHGDANQADSNSPRVLKTFIAIDINAADITRIPPDDTNNVPDVPDGNVPDMNIPDINVPDINVPDINIPDINMMEITIADINLPDVNLPDVNLPDVNTPDVNVPDINTPDANDIEMDFSGGVVNGTRFQMFFGGRDANTIIKTSTQDSISIRTFNFATSITSGFKQFLFVTIDQIDNVNAPPLKVNVRLSGSLCRKKNGDVNDSNQPPIASKLEGFAQLFNSDEKIIAVGHARARLTGDANNLNWSQTAAFNKHKGHKRSSFLR